MSGVLAESESVPESEESGGLRRGVVRTLGWTAAWVGVRNTWLVTPSGAWN